MPTVALRNPLTPPDYIAIASPSGDATGATDVAAINAAIAAAVSAGIGIVRGVSGKTYRIAPVSTQQVQYPSGSALAARSYCVQIPSGITLDMNGSTVKIMGSTQALAFSNQHLDFTTRDTDIGLRNVIIDGNALARTTTGMLQFSYVDRLNLYNVRITNGNYVGGWVYDCTDSDFDLIKGDTFTGQPWSFGDPQVGGSGHNMVYQSRFGSVSGRDIVRLNGGSQPGNPFYCVLQDCVIESIEAFRCDGGVKVNNPSSDVTIGQAVLDTCGEAISLNSGFKLQGNEAYGGLVSFTGDTVSGTNTILLASSIVGLVAGTPITGTGIPALTYIVSAVGSTVTLSKNATANGTTVTFTQTEQRYCSRINVGQVIAKNQANIGLYMYWSEDCAVGSYIGYNNVTIHNANADVYIAGGKREFVGSIKSINSYGGGVIITTGNGTASVGFHLPNIEVVNPGQYASALIKQGVRVDFTGSIGRIGDVYCIDDQGSHTMSDGFAVTVSGCTISIQSFASAGQTGSAFISSSTGVSVPAYTVTNPSTDRGLNVTGDTTAQVAAVLGTLIADAQARGNIR